MDETMEPVRLIHERKKKQTGNGLSLPEGLKA
jgi:hypothetical protein